MSKYVDRVLAELKEKNAHEAEFLQTAEEVSLLQFRDEWARFKARHPKFSPFLKAAYTRALREDSVISLKVTAPDGTEVASNLKVKKEDLELLSRIMNS